MSLWQKPEQDTERTPRTSTGGRGTMPATPSETPNMGSNTTMNTGTTPSRGVANIGQSVQIKGELSGNEDLTVDGNIDGKIVLQDHHLTIGTNGRITADVHAKAVTIQGEVTGNITADDKVEVAPSGTVNGDITAPRVALADGSSFKGSIDMSRKTKSASSGSVTTTTADRSMVASPSES